MGRRRNKCLAMVLLLFGWFSGVTAQEVVLYPEEYTNGIRNPLKGFAPVDWTDPNFRHPFRTFSKVYIRWNELENSESDTIDRIIAVTNQKLAGFMERNIKGMPRVYLEWPPNGNFWPADMTAGDYTSTQFRTRVSRLVQRLGQVWDNDPRIAWIEMGIIGDFGEHFSPHPDESQQQLLGDLFTQHFKHKKVMNRYPAEFRNYRFGIYWDSFANRNEEYVAQGIETLGDKWKIAVFNGEVAYNWGTPPGANPNETVNDPYWRDRLLDYIYRYHNVGLSWVSGFNYSDPTTLANARTIQRAFGYHFVVNEVRYPQTITGSTFSVTFKVRNFGAALMYYNWPVEVSLLDTNTRQPVWKKEFAGVDITTWYGGNDYDMTNNRYRITAATYAVSGTFTLPPTISSGVYYLALAVLEPSNMLPNLRFNIRNYFTGGRHPIGRIGVRVPVSDPVIPPALFDNIDADTTLRYSTHGFIPPTCLHAVAVSSRQVYLSWQDNWIGEAGFRIERKTGQSGTYSLLATVGADTTSYTDTGASPDTIYFYRVKTFDAFKESTYGSEAIVRTPAGGSVTWYTLTASVNPVGSGSVSPASGTYAAYSNVTMTAVPAANYAFSHWTGHASGTAPVVTITMDADKSVVAHFVMQSSNAMPTVSLISPVNGSTYSAPATVNLAATATDSDGGIARVEFWTGATLLNADTASPYAYSWTGVGAGSYALRAIAYDDRNATSTSTAVSVTVYSSGSPVNQPPSVTLTSPVNNSTYTAPASITMIAQATDSDGAIAVVRFYQGTTMVGQDSTSPYDHTWTNVSSGTYQLRAVATDNHNATSTSTVVTVTVLFSSTPAVWYSLTATANPANGGSVSPASGTYLAGSQIQVTATPNASYTFANWSGNASGTNPTVTLTMDSDKSITANFTYVPPANSSPTVGITSPQDGATYTAPASITITATAIDSDGSIAAVRFYSGTTLLNTDRTSPYEYTWTDVPPGTYVLTARAEDDRAAVGMSASLSVTVNAQPVYYTLTVAASPSNGGTITQNPSGTILLAGTPVTLTATPSAGYEFAGWSGDISQSSTTNPITVVMDENKSLTALFRQVAGQQPVLQPGEVRLIGNAEGYVNATTNPNVTIRFRRTAAGVVTARIYDLRGRLVAERSKDGIAGIDDDIAWNAAELPAGVYLVRIMGGGLVAGKRVVIAH